MASVASADAKASRSIESIVEAAAELLPEQAPLHAFVHHNTLHSFEELPFEEAVVEASKVLGTESFLSEAAFAEHLRSGRIRPEDVEAVLLRDLADEAEVLLFEGGPSNLEFRRLRLKLLFEIPGDRQLDWTLSEEGALRKAHPAVESVAGPGRVRALAADGSASQTLSRLWSAFEACAPRVEPARVGPRLRDRLVAAARIDPDLRVHPVLIRWAAAFLDQGIAYWVMGDRSRGFLSAMRRFHGHRAGLPDPWLRGFAKTVRQQEGEGWSALRTIEWALEEMGVAESEREDVIRATLLSLRGWAGMFRHLELRPDRAPVESPPASLLDFLAVQLLLDLFAARACLREAGVEDLAHGFEAIAPTPASSGIDRQRVYEAFVLAQLSSVPIERILQPDAAARWLDAVCAFDEIERRRILHLAYEHRHRVEVLDALASRSPGPRRGEGVQGGVPFQAVFCIDDREESLRRHLEAIEPGVETFGYAGFFGVAMNYQGLDDVRSRPLCPVVTQPRHLVAETANASDELDRYRSRRRRRASLSHASQVGARTLVRGGLASPILGPLSMIPLIGRSAFPRAAHRFSEMLAKTNLRRPRTRLSIEAESDEVDVDAAVRAGYSVEEMTDIVAAALSTMALDPSRSRLVLIVGHGSSSLNNPHEAAHDCGATGGGRGGPNARAFAFMANHPGVRERLKARSNPIPPETKFLGAYHNTCDDSMTYFDEDLLEASHRADLDRARRAFAKACELDAHERCRRFESAPLGISLSRAIVEVEAHAVDLGQPRPEYGHATNAVCLVGRRSRTRGLFLDRRAFLVSYDPVQDPEGKSLAPLLLSVGPVGAGINLEYYFSCVDPAGYGSGTKLPHNITGLIGVMNGHSSDLRTGLPWQMVEIHEPVRLLTIVDAKREVLEGILEEHAPLRKLISRGWIQFVGWDPDSSDLYVYEKDGFVAYRPQGSPCPVVANSIEYYRGHRKHLPPAWIDGGTPVGEYEEGSHVRR